MAGNIPRPNVKLTGAEQEAVDKRRAEEAEKQRKELAKEAEQDRSTEVVDPDSPLKTDRGDTTIDDKVVQKLAEIAAREVNGVYAMGNAAQRTVSSIAGRLSGNPTAGPSGVSVHKGEVQTSVDLAIVVEYGYSIVKVSDEIRANIIDTVQQSTGLEVVDVNITVSDIHIPGLDDDDEDTSANAQLK